MKKSKYLHWLTPQLILPEETLRGDQPYLTPVSYTHLTLPTSDLV